MKTQNVICLQQYSAPCGDLLLGSFEGKLCLCDWLHGRQRDRTERKLREALSADYEPAISPVLSETILQLDEYFSRKRQNFDIPLLLVGTDFQKRVWQSLMDIPYGVTISYAELARRVGDAKAVRAVASANAANPISILVPCHRVIGANHKLVGYGGGLPVKKHLLELEQLAEETQMAAQL